MSKVISIPVLEERDQEGLIENLLQVRVKLNNAIKILRHGELKEELDEIWHRINVIDIALKLNLKEVTIG